MQGAEPCVTVDKLREEPMMKCQKTLKSGKGAVCALLIVVLAACSTAQKQIASKQGSTATGVFEEASAQPRLATHTAELIVKASNESSETQKQMSMSVMKNTNLHSRSSHGAPIARSHHAVRGQWRTGFVRATVDINGAEDREWLSSGRGKRMNGCSNKREGIRHGGEKDNG